MNPLLICNFRENWLGHYGRVPPDEACVSPGIRGGEQDVRGNGVSHLWASGRAISQSITPFTPSCCADSASVQLKGEGGGNTVKYVDEDANNKHWNRRINQFNNLWFCLFVVETDPPDYPPSHQDHWTGSTGRQVDWVVSIVSIATKGSVNALLLLNWMRLEEGN